jgi:hypothetical protein
MLILSYSHRGKELKENLENVKMAEHEIEKTEEEHSLEENFAASPSPITPLPSQ